MTAADEYAARIRDLVGSKERLAGSGSIKQKPTVSVKNILVCISGYCIVMGLSESSGIYTLLIVV